MKYIKGKGLAWVKCQFCTKEFVGQINKNPFMLQERHTCRKCREGRPELNYRTESKPDNSKTRKAEPAHS